MTMVMPPPNDNEGVGGQPRRRDNALSLSLPSHLPTTHGHGWTVTVTPPLDDEEDNEEGAGGW